MSSSSLAPKSLLAMASGSPLEAAEDRFPHLGDIPAVGLHEVSASPDGASSLDWVRAVVAPLRQRDTFIRTIEEGAIPRAIPPPSRTLSYTRCYYLSLEELQSRRVSVSEVLGLTEPLVDLASKARATRCHSCGAINPVFCAASELVEEISRSWRGRSIQIELRGASEEIQPWAQNIGFSARTATDGASTARLDAFVCEDSRCRELQPVLEATRGLGASWIEVHDQTDRAEYSWHGRCAVCRAQNPPFRKTLLREALQRGDARHAHVEMSRVIAGTPLSNMVRLPLERLIEISEIARLITPSQREVIQIPRVGSLALMDLSTSISPRTLALLPLLSHAGREGDQGDLFLIDPPSDLIAEGDERSLRSAARGIARRAPLVWLRTPHATPFPINLEAPNSRALGAIVFPTGGQPSLEVRLGEWRSVHSHATPTNERAATLLARAINGEPNHAFAFTPASQFSAHLIPLFSVDANLTRLVAHELGVIEPLAKLFASSHQAKMLGLTARDLAIGQARLSPSVCDACRGSGLVLAEEDSLLSGSSLCVSCQGARFKSPARDTTFKGKTLWQILNSPISETTSVLRALPKMSQVLELITLLDLADIPLGMPVSLLSRTHRRLLSAVKAAISATQSRPSLVIMEEPYVGLTSKQVSGLADVVTHPHTKTKVAWVGVQSL